MLFKNYFLQQWEIGTTVLTLHEKSWIFSHSYNFDF